MQQFFSSFAHPLLLWFDLTWYQDTTLLVSPNQILIFFCNGPQAKWFGTFGLILNVLHFKSFLYLFRIKLKNSRKVPQTLTYSTWTRVLYFHHFLHFQGSWFWFI